MNKQEAIERIKNIDTLNINDMIADQQINMVVKNQVLDIISQIDEPKKPVVPKFVAEWVDDSREYRYDFDEWFDCDNQPEKVYDWLNTENKRQADIHALSLVTLIVNGPNAVEIEKEKLYTVEIPNPNAEERPILFKKRDGKVQIIFPSVPCWRVVKNAQLTESEIKEGFEWAWQFATEVKE